MASPILREPSPRRSRRCLIYQAWGQREHPTVAALMQMRIAIEVAAKEFEESLRRISKVAEQLDKLAKEG